VIADTGLFLIHTIGSDVSTRHGNPWSEKYIFPNSMLPSIRQLGAAIEGLFTMEDWHNFSASYDPTLMAWFRNFDRNWSAIEQKYGSRFYRMWKYYLLSFAGAFRARSLQLWQVVLATRGIPGGYEPVR
jgi:cyclopropane-fatty-acyl-phospholipid synthase